MHRLNQPANPTAAGVAVPEHSIPQRKAVRLGVFLPKLDLGQQLAVLLIYFVDRTIVRLHAPEVPIVPGQPVSPDARSRDTTHDFTRFGLDQVDVSRSWNRLPIF